MELKKCYAAIEQKALELAIAGPYTFPDIKHSFGNVATQLDGQHRLAGAEQATGDIELFVIAFLGLPISEQVRQFIVINREAVGVPTSLYYDLLKQLPSKKTLAELAKERAADINERLRKDTDSVFYNRIVYNSPRKGFMSLTNFVRKVSPLVAPKGKFHLYTFEEQVGILNNYFKALENVFPKEFDERTMRFLGTLGFGAIVNILPTVFDVTLKNYNGFTVEDAAKVLKTVERFNFSDWDQYGTGGAAEIRAGEDLRDSILAQMEQQEQPGSLRL